MRRSALPTALAAMLLPFLAPEVSATVLIVVGVDAKPLRTAGASAAKKAVRVGGYRDAHGVLVVVLREPSVVKHLERLERGRVTVEVVE